MSYAIVERAGSEVRFYSLSTRGLVASDRPLDHVFSTDEALASQFIDKQAAEEQAAKIRAAKPGSHFEVVELAQPED